MPRALYPSPYSKVAYDGAVISNSCTFTGEGIALDLLTLYI